jgi:phosphohistidine phosphatase
MDRDEAIAQGIEEESRPLLSDGKENSKKVSEFLIENGIEIGELISSPFLRALETAEVVKKTFKYDGKITISEALLPERNFDDFLALLKQRSDGKKALFFVGHEPNLSHVVSSILGSRKSFIQLKKSGIALVEIDTISDAAAGNAMLKALVYPKML